MIGGAEKGELFNERDHILVVHQVDYQNMTPTFIYYTHAVAYPEDGVYGTGIKQGKIELTGSEKNILEGKWSENGGAQNTERILNRAKVSKTEIRRLNKL